MDILTLLKSMDKEQLQKSIEAAKAYLNTDEGKKTAKMLSEGKMPDGQSMPDDLKQAAKAVKDDPAAKKILKGFIDKNG